ncbi:fMet-Leu-Phe receptor [Biomphalaria pfeifferi]|uniref:fMet-Leu-Phe receptor n=1 Tax=Biomphalaria pfeifferi TaxID=112525 RepID=A0AAD8AP27_BIOPF|nr:fMet-Leu-Phe receptor [Biomphalaria pfeifferi]
MANFTSTVLETSAIISKYQYSITMLFISSCIIVLATCSMTGNILSIKTFILMGLDDGMTITFFVLSLTELIFCVFAMAMSVSFLFHCFELLHPLVTFSVDPYGLLIYFGNICIMVHMSIQVITTFLAVARCMCVVKPIHFKNAFTIRRCVALLIFVWAFSLARYLPLFASMAIFTQHDPKKNVTRPALWLSPNRQLVKDIIWTIADTTIPFCTEIIVIICLMIMTDGLRRAANFRMSSSNVLKPLDLRASQKLSGKELLIIKQVALISGFYLLTNTPKVASNIFVFAEPQFTLGGQYNDLYMVIIISRNLIETLNCSISFPVYFKCNPKFRSLTFQWSKKH